MSRRRVRSGAGRNRARYPVERGHEPTPEQARRFERATVVDQEGLSRAVYRRRDNLLALRGALDGARLNALVALRMASEAGERGLVPRCALDRSPGGGADGFVAVIQHRIDAKDWAAELWRAVPACAVADTHAVVVAGASVERAARATAGRLAGRRSTVLHHLRLAADGVIAALDARYGRSRLRAVKVP